MKTKTKLTLNLETLRRLNDQETKHVAGAGDAPWCGVTRVGPCVIKTRPHV